MKIIPPLPTPEDRGQRYRGISPVRTPRKRHWMCWLFGHRLYEVWGNPVHETPTHVSRWWRTYCARCAGELGPPVLRTTKKDRFHAE